jgi:MFS family permease
MKIKNPILGRLHWSAAPIDATPTQRENFLRVQLDAIGIGIANVAIPFLPIFLTRLGASNFQVGLLTSMPAITGLILSIAMGSYLQRRRHIVPWFSRGRLIAVSSYALMGLATILVPREYAILSILVIWLMATFPQTLVGIAFSVVMNAVAGPTKRFDLMSRRWSILGITSSITTVIVGIILEKIPFPSNYQYVFIALSIGGLISYYFSSHIDLPASIVPPKQTGLTLKERLNSHISTITHQRAFISFIGKRFVFLFGQTLALPLFPLYYVHQVHATDAWIAIITTSQTVILLFGYFLWTRESRQRGSRFVLLWATFGLALYPAVIASTRRLELIALYAGLAGVLQAGIDLVFFDELMKTIPPEYSPTFVSWSQSAQYTSTMVAPLLGTLLSNYIGIPGALFMSAGLRLIGFLLFALGKERSSGILQIPNRVKLQ